MPKKVKKIVLTFEEWLHDQQDRKDHIGDLAHMLSQQDLTRLYSRRKWDEHKRWSDVVIDISEPGYVAIFNAAWLEFVSARQRAKDALD